MLLLFEDSVPACDGAMYEGMISDILLLLNVPVLVISQVDEVPPRSQKTGRTQDKANFVSVTAAGCHGSNGQGLGHAS